MVKYLALFFFLFVTLITPVNGQQDNSLQIVQLITLARQAIADNDLKQATVSWRTAQSLMERDMSVAAFADPRYYYITRWMGRAMLADDRAAEAEPFLSAACSRQALIYSSRNDDVIATVAIYAEILNKNGKPGQAQEVVALWNEINGREAPAMPALSTTPSAGQATPSASSSTQTAYSAVNGVSDRNKAIEQLKHDLLGAPLPAPGGAPAK